jgi:hypothetical protein
MSNNFYDRKFIERRLGEAIDFLVEIGIFLSVLLFMYYVATEKQLLGYAIEKIPDKLLVLLLIIPYVYVVSLLMGPIVLMLRIAEESKKQNDALVSIKLEMMRMHERANKKDADNIARVNSINSINSEISQIKHLISKEIYDSKSNEEFLSGEDLLESRNTYAKVVIEKMWIGDRGIDSVGMYIDYIISAFIIIGDFASNPRSTYVMLDRIMIRGYESQVISTKYLGQISLSFGNAETDQDSFLYSDLKVSNDFTKYVYLRYNELANSESSPKDAIYFFMHALEYEGGDGVLKYKIMSLAQLHSIVKTVSSSFYEREDDMVIKLQTKYSTAEDLLSKYNEFMS